MFRNIRTFTLILFTLYSLHYVILRPSEEKMRSFHFYIFWNTFLDIFWMCIHLDVFIKRSLLIHETFTFTPHSVRNSTVFNNSITRTQAFQGDLTQLRLNYLPAVVQRSSELAFSQDQWLREFINMLGLTLSSRKSAMTYDVI